MDVEKILESLKENKITVNQAKKLLSLYSIEEIEGFAKIDINRKYRRGIPEVIFAETKELDEIKKIVKRVLEKSNAVIVSRLKKNDYSKIKEYSKKLKVNIKTGKNSSSLLLYKKTIKQNGGKVGIFSKFLTKQCINSGASPCSKSWNKSTANSSASPTTTVSRP